MSNWQLYLHRAILTEYPDAHPVDDFELINTGAGIEIKTWNEAKLGPFVEVEWMQKCNDLKQAQTIAIVKSEAERRILLICPVWKQRNLTARAAELAIKGVANWTADEQSEVNAGQLLWDQIKAIREASDALEAMDPIPQDFDDDSYWPS
ncbi:MAG: hypothetical protein ABJL55_16310 [Roseibium sp.]